MKWINKEELLGRLKKEKLPSKLEKQSGVVAGYNEGLKLAIQIVKCFPGKEGMANETNS